jgi:cytochrome P450
VTEQEQQKAGTGTQLPSFTDPRVLMDIDRAFDAVRAAGPVFRSPELRMVLVTGYDEAVQVLKDTDRFSNRRTLKTAGGKRQPQVTDVLKQLYPPVETLISTDGDKHSYHAGLIKGYLSRKRISSFAEPIASAADKLLDTFTPGETVEFVDRFSLPLTIDVLCMFTGVPYAEHQLVQQATDAEVEILGNVGSVERNVANAKLIVRMQQLLTRLIAERTAEPCDDLISHLVHTPPPPGMDPLTLAETVSILRGVVLGGNETTRGLINASVYKLAQDPGLLNRIRHDKEGFDKFLDEALRHTSPVVMLFRNVTRDTELGGVALSAGEMVGVAYGAANHDPAKFGCPHQWDLDRPNLRRHLAFGFGTHYCVGSPLGRLEATVALKRIIERFDTIEIAPGGEPAFVPSFMVRNMTSLPVRFTPSRRR